MKSYLNCYLNKLNRNKYFRDLKLIMNYIVSRRIKMEYPRNINDINYWEESVDIMLDHYISQKTKVQLAEEKIISLFFKNYIKKLNSKTVLEVGCGFGYTLKTFAYESKQVEFFGCDFSLNLINAAKDYCKGCINKENFKVGDVTKFKSIYDKKFDLIFTSSCLMCLTTNQIKSFLKQAKQLTNQFLFFEPDYSDMGFLENLRFKRDRSYPINNYKKIVQEVDGLRLYREEKINKFKRLFIVEVTK